MAKGNSTTSKRRAPNVIKHTLGRLQAVPRKRVFDAMNTIENALVDVEGTAFAIDMATTHLSDDEDKARCLDVLSRHLSSDMVALREAFRTAHAGTFAGKGGAA